MDMIMSNAPLSGLRIIEMGGIGPGPFACMMLADAGAEVVRIDRPGATWLRAPANDILGRGRARREVVDLRSEKGLAVARALIADADGLVEGFRPGVMEALGLGPDPLRAENPRLVYGRMTGWGQSGPRAQVAGHDINYIATAGALHAFGRAGDKPTPPCNVVGDFGGGGMMLAFGMTAALLAVARGETGRVVDCAMVDGAALQTSVIWSLRAEGRWRDERGVNLLDSGAPFYDSYETADGRYVAIGALEPAFYAALLKVLGVANEAIFARQMDETLWPAMRDRITTLFRERTRDEWVRAFDGIDACFAPVLSLDEAVADPHNRERGTFIESQGMIQPAPAPRFSAPMQP
jgi:alpha-methylacyl-CoA racemase